MFKSRILTYAEQTLNKTMKELENMTYKLPHMTEKWDQSWRDMENPGMAKVPLHYIAKAIGRVNLAPVELCQAYLTQPEMRDKLSMVTFDEAELRKLKADLLARPEEYIAIFTKKDPKIHDLLEN